MSKILVIDDEKLTLSIVGKVLADAGYDVNTCASTEAKRNLSDNEYDLVLTDVQMPDVDGVEVAVFIRTELPELKKKMPIIGMSSGGDMYDAQASLDMIKPFTNDLLFKPVEPALLLEKVQKLLAA